MKYRVLGSDGPVVSSIGFGCVALTGMYGSATPENAASVIGHALDAGITLFDTADNYGDGENERIVGRALGRRRNDVVLASKAGIVQGTRATVFCGRPDYLKNCCDHSLQRLATDYLDLYYLHRIDASVPVEESMGAFVELVGAGKVRYIGISEASPDALERAAAVAPVTALQSEWSLWTRDLESEVLDVGRRLGIGIVAYSPLGRGFLAGAVRSADDLSDDDYRRSSPRFVEENLARNTSLIEQLERLANEKRVKSSQIALAWLLKQGDDIVPIPGTRTAEHLYENIASLEVVLEQADMNLLARIFPPGAAAGARYADTAYHDGESPRRS